MRAASSKAIRVLSHADYAQGRKALVIHEDDVGMTHGSNVAFRELSARGVVSSGSVMVPCPWFPETLAMAAAEPSLEVMELSGVATCAVVEFTVRVTVTVPPSATAAVLGVAASVAVVLPSA